VEKLNSLKKWLILYTHDKRVGTDLFAAVLGGVCGVGRAAGRGAEQVPQVGGQDRRDVRQAGRSARGRVKRGHGGGRGGHIRRAHAAAHPRTRHHTGHCKQNATTRVSLTLIFAPMCAEKLCYICVYQVGKKVSEAILSKLLTTYKK